MNKKKLEQGEEEIYRDEKEKNLIYFKANAAIVAQEYLNKEDNEWRTSQSYSGETAFYIKINAEGVILEIVGSPTSAEQNNPDIYSVYIRME